jgi:hypothetical protein
MERRIKIKVGNIEKIALLNDSNTAILIWNALPIEGKVNTWGDEIYFSIPVKTELEAPQEIVNLGDIGYWPEGQAFCIFFGPTPISSGGKIRPASSVCVIGKLCESYQELKKIRDGEIIRIEKA